jgi:hypothetical protein
MNPAMRRMHDALWDKFYRNETHLVYDNEITDFAVLPTAGEVAASIPNCAGWGTWMEDCALNGGFLLEAMVTAHRLTGETEWANKARSLFKGLVALGTAGPTKGFVARGFAPGRTHDVYPNSSTDQYTSFVFGVWRYAISEIPTHEERATACTLLTDIAALIESFGDNIPRMDMRPSIYGDTNTIEPGRACRILMFYKAAHELSGDTHWRDRYVEKVEEQDRVRLRTHYGPEVWDLRMNTHAVIQSQTAFRLLFESENDAVIRDAYRKALSAEAQSVIVRIPKWREIVSQPMGRALPPRWREFWPAFAKDCPDHDLGRIEDVQRFSRYMRDHAREEPVAPDVVARAKPMLPWLRHQTESLAIAMLCDDSELKLQAAEAGRSMLNEVDWPLVGQSCVWAGLELAYWHGLDSGVLI